MRRLCTLSIGTILLGALLTAGCARKTMLSAQRVSSGGVSVWSTWVKDKGSKFDIDYNVRNEGSVAIVIPPQEFLCSRGNASGTIRKSSFSAPKPMALGPGATEAIILTCELSSPDKGDYRITLGKIYDNPSGDRQTKGQVLAENVDLILGPDGAVKSSGLASSPPPPRPSSASAPAATPATAPPPASTPVSVSGTRSAITAKPDWVIAVMDVEDGNAGVRESSIDKSLVRNIGDQLRVFIAQRGIRTIDRGMQDRALQEQIQSAKADSYKSCYDNSCQVELGKALAASHILRARITRFGKRCVLNAELVDLRAEVSVSAASSQGDCAAEGFLTMSEDVARNITGLR